MRFNNLTSEIDEQTSRFAAFDPRNLPKAPVASGIAGAIVAALILMTPNEYFEAIVVATGLPGVLAAAEPPLGAKARIVTALIFAAVIMLVGWAALSIALRKRQPAFEPDEALPRLRRADAHPDAPPRRPIFAHDDLGAPFELVDSIPASADEDFSEMADADEAMELGSEAIIWEPEAVDWRAEAHAAVVDDEEVEPMVASHFADTEKPVLAQSAAPFEDEPFATDTFEPVTPAPAFTFKPEPEPELKPAPRRPRLDPRTVQTLSALVDRLEEGLNRRRSPIEGRRAAGVGDYANVTSHPVADRSMASDMDSALRDALDALQRLQAKGA